MIMSNEQERIVGVLQNAGKELSTREIAERAGINWANTKKILQNLYKEKAVTWGKVKNRNLWKLAEQNKKSFPDMKLNKEQVERLPETTIKVTGHALRYILAIVIVYLIISMLWLIYTKREEFLMSIVLWSIGGFWAFFMGYYGWMLAQQIHESMTNRIKRRREKRETKKDDK
jgi:DNA-binding transcriptional regulator YhcF (GntR family)